MNMYGCAVKGFFAIFLLGLLGCSTPKAKTKVYDNSYQDKFSTLEVLFVRGKFPGSNRDIRRSGINELSWYNQVGNRLMKNFKHNDISMSINVLQSAMHTKSSLLTRSRTVPTLVLYPQKVFTSSKSPIVGIEMHALLYAPNRDKPVWKAVSGVSAHRTGDKLSLKLLNELSALKLIDLKGDKAETVDGKKNATFGGVLTR